MAKAAEWASHLLDFREEMRTMLTSLRKELEVANGLFGRS